MVINYKVADLFEYYNFYINLSSSNLICKSYEIYYAILIFSSENPFLEATAPPLKIYGNSKRN
jgi:hypothetical protein